MKRAIPRFMVVLDQAPARLPLPEVARSAIAGGADLIQVREKTLERDQLRELAEQVISAIGDPIFVSINTDTVLAGELGANLHLPECADFNLLMMRLDPKAIVGRSIHSADVAATAEQDYLLLGNLLETGSKPGKVGLGLEEFAEIASQVTLPVLAIGGIRPHSVAVAFEGGAYGVAVSSYVNASEDPERAAREIRIQIDKWTS